MEERCVKCVYYALTYRCCDYLSFTGHLRSDICPPGDACTVFKQSEGKRTSRRVTHDWVGRAKKRVEVKV